MPPSLPHIRAGKLRALAGDDGDRSEALPDVRRWPRPCQVTSEAPFTDERARTPPELSTKLNKEINAGLADPRSRLACGARRHAVPAVRPTSESSSRRKPTNGQGDQGSGVSLE